MSVAIPGHERPSLADRLLAGGSLALRGGARTMRLASDAFNVALLVAAAWATLKFWDKAEYYYRQSGGVPDPREFGCSLGQHQCGPFLQSMLPTLHLRVYWLALAWAAAVAAGGLAVLTVGGLRWAYWRAHDYLSVEPVQSR